MKVQIEVKIPKNLSNLILHILPFKEIPICISENACKLFWQPGACHVQRALPYRQRPHCACLSATPAPRWCFRHNQSECYRRREIFLCFNQMQVFPNIKSYGTSRDFRVVFLPQLWCVGRVRHHSTQ